MIIPPSPGNISWMLAPAVSWLSLPAVSSNPLTIMASDSSSESKTFTSFSFGLGCAVTLAAGFKGSGMGSPVQDLGPKPNRATKDFTPNTRSNSPDVPQKGCRFQDASCGSGTNPKGHLQAVAFFQN